MIDSEEQELRENLPKQSDELLQNIASDTYELSILVTGGSQAGKSSIIKAIFGEEVAVGSDGKKIVIGLNRKPVTQYVTSYVDPENHFELIDTPGLEKNVLVDRVSQIRKELVEKQLRPSVIWLVLNYSSAIEDVELELINLARETVVIIILNKCDFLQKKKEDIQKNPRCLEHFDELSENELPEWMKKKRALIAKRNRLLEWKNNHERVRRILITSMGSGEEDDDDETPIGLETIIQATWSCLDDVGRILLAQLQQNAKMNKINGSTAIVLAAAMTAAGAAWIPIPVVDSIAISSIQVTMVISLYKYWGVAGVDAKTFSTVFLKSLAPVLVSFGAGYSIAHVFKFFYGIGSVIGGTLDASIAFTGTTIIGTVVTAYLSEFVYNRHQTMTEEAFKRDLQSYMQSNRFKNIVDGIKNLAKNPRQITNRALVELIQQKK